MLIVNQNGGTVRSKIMRLFFMLASLLAATSLACQAGPLTGLLASATPTSTWTPTPSSTPLPTSTPTQTPTFTPPPEPLGVETEEQADGTFLLTDLDNKYQVTFPRNWSPILISQKNKLVVPSEVAAKDPEYRSFAESMKDADPEFVRMISIETESKYLYGSYPTLIFVMAVYDLDYPLSGLGMSAMTSWVEDHMLNQATIISWNVMTNAKGVEIGINDATQQLSAGSGTVEVSLRIISFQTRDKLIMIQVSTPSQSRAAIFSKLESIYDTIELTDR